MVKTELLISVCVNGRPIWRKAKSIRAELSLQMNDKEYDRVLDASAAELATQVKTARARMAEKEKVVAK